MDRNRLLAEIIGSGVVAIVRLSSSESLLQVAEAIAAGGVQHIEFTMTTPGTVTAAGVLVRTTNSQPGSW